MTETMGPGMMIYSSTKSKNKAGIKNPLLPLSHTFSKLIIQEYRAHILSALTLSTRQRAIIRTRKGKFYHKNAALSRLTSGFDRASVGLYYLSAAGVNGQITNMECFLLRTGYSFRAV